MLDHVVQADMTWVVRDIFRPIVLGSGAPDWLDLASCPDAECVETGQHRTVWRIPSSDQDLFVKASRVAGLRDRIKAWLLGTPAEREWRIATAATAAGVRIPDFVALGVGSGWTRRSLLLTVAVRDATSLAAAWRDITNGRPSPGRQREANRLVDAVADFLRLAHQAGFMHRDGHPNNVLVSRPASSTCLDVYYVDTHGSRLYPRGAPAAAMARSLAQLDQYFHRVASRSDRLRFLRRYLAPSNSPRTRGDGRAQRRAWVAAIRIKRARLAKALARLRDRRLRRHGKYFGRLYFRGGWRAFVCLKLERRHLFPEPGVPDRTADQWRDLLERWLGDLARDPNDARILPAANMVAEFQRIERFADRLRHTLGKSPHRRAFECCHRLRHRDHGSELVLAVVEHRTAGLVDRTLLLRRRASGQVSDPAPCRANGIAASPWREVT